MTKVKRCEIKREMTIESLEELCDLMCGGPEDDSDDGWDENDWDDDSEGGLIAD